MIEVTQVCHSCRKSCKVSMPLGTDFDFFQCKACQIKIKESITISSVHNDKFTDKNYLKERLDKLFKEIRLKFPIHGTLNINIKRMQFVEQIKTLAKIKMGKNLNIKFEGEGGLIVIFFF